MRCRESKQLQVGVVIWLLLLLSAQAIIVADYTIAEAPPTDLSDGDWDFNWDFIYRYKESSGVAVAPNWLLTAAHVADDAKDSNVVTTNATHVQQEIVFHASVHDPDNNAKADLALVRFEPAFAGYYPLYEGAFPTNVPDRLAAILVGYGRIGTVSNTFYNEINAGSGTKRWGTQKIDGPFVASYNSGGLTGVTTNQGIFMLFNLGDTPYEAGVGVNDSGGGVFVKENGTWKLAGTMTLRFGASPNFTGVFAVAVPDYVEWIMNVITPTADLDGDGIPNYWEQQYSGSQTGLVASADIDGDGFTNLQEYIADTDPTDIDSFLRVDLGEGEVDALSPVFTFTGSTARQYRVKYSTNNLIDAAFTWLPAQANTVPGTGPDTVIALTNMPPGAIYRLQVSLP